MFVRLHRNICVEDNWGTEFLLIEICQAFWIRKEKKKKSSLTILKRTISQKFQLGISLECYLAL